MANPEFIETKIRFASMRQIHAAIDHLHSGDFECAITLAGAGEGMLPETDNPHFRQKVKALEAMLPEGDEGEKGPNAYINWLKHGTLKKGGARIENARITELEVIVTIWRGITKFEAVYVVVDADRTPQMIGFANWARAHLQNAENPN
jgi:hypothetical protein